MNSLLINKSILFIPLVMLLGCMSAGPKTRYYTLMPDGSGSDSELSINVAEERGAREQISLGVGPVILPEYTRHPGIVSRNEVNRILVSGTHAWAGDLKQNIGRVVSGNISDALQLENVWKFPWDNRVRPQYQLRLVFEDFVGTRGGKVRLACRWALLNKQGNRRLKTGLEEIELETVSAEYSDYVLSLNRALNRLSQKLAEEMVGQLNSNVSAVSQSQ